MIPILYESDLSGVSTNGIGRLSDCTSCVVTEERNGEYTLTMQTPFKGKHADELKVDRIIMALPNDTSQPQYFRIVKINKNMKGMSLEVLANHISYDMSFIPVQPFSATVTGRYQAFETLWENTLENNPFLFDAPADTLVKKFGTTVPVSLRAMLGGVEGSMLDVFGGEYEFDNRTVKWHLHRGSDRGVTIRYGKNLSSYEQEENISETVCGILPYYSMDETVVYGDIQYCSNADDFALKRTVPYDFTPSFEDGDTPTAAKLNTKARAYIEENTMGIPEVSIHVEFRQLWQTPEYRHLKDLEHVSLCDTVSVYFPQLAVTAKAKVVKTEYDCLLERYNYVELGSVRQDISDRIASVSDQLSKTVNQKELRVYQNEVSTLLADKISTNVFTAYQAQVTSLLADKVDTNTLTAYEAEVTLLLAAKASVDDLNAVTAVINRLDTTYAQIDFANVNTALISSGFAEQFLVSQGLIADAVTAESAQITGYLTGVGIVANSIRTGTLDAGNITVTNLNCASLTVGQINGQQIAAGAVSMSNLATDASTAITTAGSNASAALQAAQQCVQLVDGKATVFYQASAPTGGTYSENDIWFDTDDGNKMYRWDGSAWSAQTFGESALSAGAVTANKIAAGAVVAAALAANAVTAEKIAAGVITASHISSGTITGSLIAAGTITGTNISSETITGDKLVANTITASKIAAGTITSNEIAANTITASKIAAGTITSTEIAAGTITAANLAAGVLTVGNISDFSSALQAAIDGIQVGGRNLIRKTLSVAVESSSVRPNLNGVAALWTSTGTVTAAEHGVRVANTSAVWTRIGFGTSDTSTGNLMGLEAGETYTVSFDCKWKVLSAATTTDDRYMVFSIADNANGAMEYASNTIFATITPAQYGTEMAARCEATFTVRKNATIMFVAIQCNVGIASHHAVGDFIEATNLKLEKGNKATDWTPAPEDVESITALNAVIADWCYNNDTTYINGGKIYTGSITADKISVTDLSALGATIGGIQINNNSISSSNGNFNVTSSGVLTATGANLNGSLTTVDGDYKVRLVNGGMNVYYNDTWYGRFFSSFWGEDPTKRGVSVAARAATSYVFLGKYMEETDSYASAYIINYDLNPSGNTERHIFYGSARFLSTVYVESTIVLNNNYAYKCEDTNGTAVGLLWLNSSNNICLYDPGHALYLGSASSSTYLRGSAISVSGTATFNSAIKANSTITFANGYGIKVTDTHGTESYAFAINTSDQLTLTSTLMDLYVYGKATYLGAADTSLYLRGTVAAHVTFANGMSIRMNNSSGAAQTVLYMNTSNQICLLNTGYDVYVYGKNTYLGNASYPTIIRGSSISIGGRTAETIYKAGDSISTTAFVFGWVTSSQKSLVLFFPLHRGIASGVTATCTAATSASLRSVSGTLVGGSSATLTSYITSTTIRATGLQVTLTKSDGWGVTNNTLVAGTVSLKFTLAASS